MINPVEELTGEKNPEQVNLTEQEKLLKRMGIASAVVDLASLNTELDSEEHKAILQGAITLGCDITSLIAMRKELSISEPDLEPQEVVIAGESREEVVQQFIELLLISSELLTTNQVKEIYKLSLVLEISVKDVKNIREELTLAHQS